MASDTPIPEGEYDEILESVAGDDPRAGDSSVEPPDEVQGDSLPPLMTAADLLEDEPLAAIPVEPPDADTPPDSAAPAFIVTPMPGRPPRITLASGVPVGVWLHEEHPALNGGQVAEMLVVMGMDGDLAAWYGIQRDRAREATGQMLQDPNVQAFADEEERRKAEKEQVQAAFLAAQKKKDKK